MDDMRLRQLLLGELPAAEAACHHDVVWDMGTFGAATAGTRCFGQPLLPDDCQNRATALHAHAREVASAFDGCPCSNHILRHTDHGGKQVQ